MKNPFSSIAVLGLSLIAGPYSFGAVVDQTDADVPAPAVQKYFPTPDTNEALTAVLNVKPELPRGPNEILKDYEAEMATITSRMSNELGEIYRAIANDQLSREQGEYLARERYQVAMMQFQLLSAWHAILEQAVTQASAAQTKDDPSPTGQAQPSARQPLQHIYTPQSIDQELARLTKDLKLTPEQRQQARPLLEEHHDRIQALLDKNPKASRQEIAPQIHAISDETHRKIHALLTGHKKGLEKAMQQREHNGRENKRPAPPAAASPEPTSWAS